MNKVLSLSGAEITENAAQFLDIPVLLRDSKDQKAVAVAVYRGDAPERQQMITQLQNLPEGQIDKVIAALERKADTEPYDMVYAGYGQIITGQNIVPLISPDLAGDAVRTINQGKLEANRFFFMTQMRLSFGLADEEETVGAADFDAILNDNNAAGTPDLIRTNVPPQIKNGRLFLQSNKTVDYNNMSGAEFFQNPYGNNAGLWKLKCGKWFTELLPITVSWILSGAYTVPTGKKAYLKIVLGGIEIVIA